MNLVLSFLSSFFVASTFAVLDNSDLVTDLPGLNFKPNFKHYSGYLNVSRTKSLHYWYVESQNDPSSDPVFLWLTGGPGCSSMDAMLSELGPFHVKDDGKTVYENPYAWNKIANVLFLESPAGVGFSYTTDGNVTTNDDLTADLNYVALKGFFNRYPDLKTHDFYITGESYAGVYVPTLAVRVLNGQTEFPLKFKGVAIGNGLLSFALNYITSVSFAYNHGLIGPTLFKNIETTCCSGCVENCKLKDSDMKEDSTCMGYISKVMNIMSNIGLNMYDLYMPCYHPSSTRGHSRFWHDMKGLFPIMKEQNLLDSTDAPNDGDPPCVNAKAATTYLGQENVRTALHIPSKLPPWALCSNNVGQHYTIQYQNVEVPFREMMKGNLRILVYNGDVDMACNFLLGERFVHELGLPLIQNTTAWHLDDQVAGFSTRYDNSVDFVTVKGSGHMVPQFKPPQALKMITQFVNNQPY